MTRPAPDFGELLRCFKRHSVDFIVVGGVGAVLRGVPIMTYDLDLVHSRDPQNLDRLLPCLAELEAVYAEHLSQRLSPRRELLMLDGPHLLMTRFGPLDLLGTIGQRWGYEQLVDHASGLQVGNGLSVLVLDLATLIAAKEIADRPKDRAMLPLLRSAMKEQGLKQGD